MRPLRPAKLEAGNKTLDGQIASLAAAARSLAAMWPMAGEVAAAAGSLCGVEDSFEFDAKFSKNVVTVVAWRVADTRPTGTGSD
jgi:hypothetical protein